MTAAMLCGQQLGQLHVDSLPCVCRKNSFSLRPQQLNFFLPGQNYTEEDLMMVQRRAEEDADQSLLELAWEVCLWSQSVALQHAVLSRRHLQAYSSCSNTRVKASSLART